MVSNEMAILELDALVIDLKQGANRLSAMALGEMKQLIDSCAANVCKASAQWVAAGCKAKRIAEEEAQSGEEILVGPCALMRYLKLLSRVVNDFEHSGHPLLPGPPRKNSLAQTCVPILPVRHLFDRFVFKGLKAEVWFRPNTDPQTLFLDSNGFTEDVEEGRISAVLGAGNSSAIPATDTLHKIFVERESVLLKLSPVNEYLYSVFKDIFRPLIDADLLRIVRGGSEVGKALVEHPEINSLHITGSKVTHDAILWGTDPQVSEELRKTGNPRIAKRITSELGNVSPWIIVPGEYTAKQLQSQAEHVVASIVNNASFNCLATKMLVTSAGWGQRDEFLGIVEKLLKAVPPRFAYYPGARERFEKATGKSAPDSADGSLPWTLLKNTSPEDSPHLYCEESFVCVCAETMLPESIDVDFLSTAVDFVNEKLFGTLCVSVTVTDEFQKGSLTELEAAIAKLRYGSVCINQWSGVMYGLMTPPWGGHPSSTIESPESGVGNVHNTFCLQNFDKAVLWGPLRTWPKPVWFHSHRSSHHVAWKLLHLYEKPSLTRLPGLFFHALRG